MLPINAKFMAKLKRYYETDEELILVIEYVAPGPLFNIVSPYLMERASGYVIVNIKGFCRDDNPKIILTNQPWPSAKKW